MTPFHERKTFLFYQGEPSVKKNTPDFDCPLGAHDSAKVCELVGWYIFSKLANIQTSLSNHIWDLKDENIQFSITWQVLEKSKSFNPISLQCLLCLSEATQILTKPNLATLNSRSETYGFCRHRKKYLLKNVKPLAFKGGALTYRYKD